MNWLKETEDGPRFEDLGNGCILMLLILWTKKDISINLVVILSIRNGIY
jgi:hypothetical protein